MTVGFQIGQCRIYVDTDRTKEFYETLPGISENCNCGNCVYFENEVIKKDIPLFKILKKMCVDLTRQPNINPDGIYSVGPTTKYNRAYIGYYQVFGKFGKTQKKTQTINADGKMESVEFFEPLNDSYIQYKILQDKDDQLIVEFYIECEKIYTDN